MRTLFRGSKRFARALGFDGVAFEAVPFDRASRSCPARRHGMAIGLAKARGASENQYPGVAAGSTLRSSYPAVSAFPEMAVGSAYTSSFSKLARRSLALRPAHSRCH